MVRTIRVELALACSYLLGTAPAVAASVSQDVAVALEADNECADDSCSLELAQHRSTKLQAREWDKARPKHTHRKAQMAHTVSHTHSKSKAADKSTTKSKGKQVKTSHSQVAKVHKSSKSSQDTPDYGHPAWLSSCKRIFLDVGANIGVSIRKLFEAQKYTGSKLLPFFDEHFGELLTRRAAGEQSGLCALGLEPNPEHRERLQALEEAYGNKGWRVHFYPFAAWDAEGEMPLNTTAERATSEADNFHRSAHLSMHLAEGQPVLASSLVRTVNLAAFIESLPESSVRLLLMDIEGAEYETLAQLMMEKKLCQSSILNLLVEAHDWGDVSKWGGPTSFSEGVHPRSTMAIGERLSQMAQMGWCEGNVTYVAKLDDPSYATDVDENFGETA